ncbi:transcription factor TFIIH complex subunit Tfb5-domain-containing protein [Lactarius hengduanensis]|nr:transcription factor TFIIH complex subunit Tfb5-domain-containing protein [Lactarius hengduanensis]
MRAIRGVLITCDSAVKQILLTLDERPGQSFIIEDLDEFHVLIRADEEQRVRRELEAEGMPCSHLTPLEAKDILAAHIPQPPTELPVVSPVPSTDADPAARARFRSYLVHSSTPAASYLVTLQISEPLEDTATAPCSVPNSIQAQFKLLCSLGAHISSEPPPIPLPFPVPVALNADVPRPYILARLPVPLTAEAASLDLRFGVALRTLHNLQSEWCGPPTLEKEGLYSWQEAFTLLLEETLSAAESTGLVSAVDLTALRGYLARAIGAFLFDDVEVPSLVAPTIGAESVFITDVDGELQLALLLPSLAHVLYGDPLLERAFSPSEAPSRALLEGYGAPPPIVFARQRTKRMWYDLYLGLVVLLGARRVGEDQNTNWAVKLVEQTRISLKDAPCY